MSIPYKLYQTSNNLEKSDSNKLYPRVVVKETIGSDKLEELMCRGNTLQLPDAKAALSALVRAMADQLSAGNNVHIDGLGTFSLSITTDQPVYKRKNLHDIHLKVSGLNLRADKAMTYNCQENGFTQESPVAEQSNIDERRQKLKVFLRNNTTINLYTYCLLANVSNKKAHQDLDAFLAEGWLKAVPCGMRKIYQLNE